MPPSRRSPTPSRSKSPVKRKAGARSSSRGAAAKPAVASPAANSSPAKAAPTSSNKRAPPRNTITTEFEFLGPRLGPYAMTLGLPLLVWASAFYLRGPTGWTTLPTTLPTLDDVAGAFSWRASAVYLGWMAFQAALYLLVPGPIAPGATLRDGTTLRYPINGMRCLLITAAAAAAVHAYVAPLTWILDNYLQLCSAAIAFSALLSLALYAGSFAPRAGGVEPLLAANSNIAIYDFFLGRELNPRALGIDLKYFCELRPGLFAWLLVDAAAALRAAEGGGGLGAGMALTLFLQGLYVCDALWSEASILTTMDIVMDGFGFMLAFGDLAWVPAMYSLQARYLADARPPPLSPAFAALAAGAGAAGFYVFRASNAQKDTFKKEPAHPSVAGLPVIKHARGALLAGGWWGAARHVNYAGDLLLALAMSLATGFATPATYFYPAYFAVLLAHRERRDEVRAGAIAARAACAHSAPVP